MVHAQIISGASAVIPAAKVAKTAFYGLPLYLVVTLTMAWLVFLPAAAPAQAVADPVKILYNEARFAIPDE